MYFQATAFWKWSNYLQQLNLDQKIQVLINVDETSLRLVPEEGKGHVSNRAYRLLCSGMPLDEFFLPLERFLRGLDPEPLVEREAQVRLPPVLDTQESACFGRTRQHECSTCIFWHP